MRSIVFGMLMFAAMPVMADDEKAEKSESKTVAFSEPTDAPIEGGPAVASGPRRRVLADRDARKFGVTFGSVRAAIKDLKASGAIDGTESNSELSAMVADHIASKKENEKAFKAGAVDWESLISFISRLLEIIMKFFP